MLFDKCYAYTTCFSELIQRKTIDLQVSLEALPVHPWWQTTVFVFCNTETKTLSRGEAQEKKPIDIQRTTCIIKS